MSVPWKAITTSAAYIEDESLPEDTLLCEPSKLQSHAVTLLWNHWRQRQNDGEIGLVFTKARAEDVHESHERERARQRPSLNGKTQGRHLPSLKHLVQVMATKGTSHRPLGQRLPTRLCSLDQERLLNLPHLRHQSVWMTVARRGTNSGRRTGFSS